MPLKTKSTGNALAKHRQRLRNRGLQRLELQVRAEDVSLVRAVAAALADATRGQDARTLLRSQFLSVPHRSLKDLLASAPLDGVELKRTRDFGRPLELCPGSSIPTSSRKSARRSAAAQPWPRGGAPWRRGTCS